MVTSGNDDDSQLGTDPMHSRVLCAESVVRWIVDLVMGIGRVCGICTSYKILVGLTGGGG